MAQKLSRRSIATYVAQQLLEGAPKAKLVDQLAAYLIESGRTKELDSIIRDIQYQLTEKGYVTGTVTSAHTLSAATLKHVEAYAKEQTRAAKVVLETEVDEALLGGIKLNLPGREMNTTIARQLTLLKTQRKKA